MNSLDQKKLKVITEVEIVKINKSSDESNRLFMNSYDK